MREIPNVRQIAGEPVRRWFSSPDFDLIVWLDDSGTPTSFELCYDKGRQERSITWSSRDGFRHMSVDDGEQRPGKYKSTPILVPDGLFDAGRIQAAFQQASQAIPREIADFVLHALMQYPSPSPDVTGRG